MSELQTIQDKLQTLFDQRDLINTEILSLREQEKTIIENEIMAKNAASPLSLADMLEVCHHGRESTFVYNKLQEYINSKEWIYSMGYNPKTNQYRISLQLSRSMTDIEVDNFCSLLESEILPAIKSTDGIKILGIFEHSLSAYGVYELEISSASFDLVIHRYTRKSVEASFASLKDAIYYIKENHYYE